MNRLRKRRLRTLAGIWVVAMLVAAYGQNGLSGEMFVQQGVICVVIVLIVDAVYRHIVPRYRKWPLVIAAPLTALLYFVAVNGAIVLAIFLIMLPVTRSLTAPLAASIKFYTSPNTGEAVAYTFGTAVGISFLLELSRRLGPGRLFNWLIGRYRSPQEEIRLFLFIDLTDSTPLAEELGALKFSYLLRDFFDDLTAPIIESDGQIVSYVGDEAIIVWRKEESYKHGEPVRCFQMFRNRIAKRSDYYREKYGVVPRFKGAIHSGPVVVTEVGQIRTEVVFHGDSLNTTARILGECSKQEAELLIWTSTYQQLPHDMDDVSFDVLEEVQLKGKGEPVGIVRARFAAAIGSGKPSLPAS